MKMLKMLLWMVAAIPVFAQSQLGTGAAAGVVLDASGAQVAGAEIKVTGVDTGMVRRVVSGATGEFLAPVLPAGRYDVLVSKPGFATLREGGVVVNVGATANLKQTLQVGDVA